MPITGNISELTKYHRIDDDGLLQFIPNATAAYIPSKDEVGTWRVDEVNTSIGKKNYWLPTSLFSIEPVISTGGRTVAMLTFNVEEYSKQEYKVKKIITDAWKRGVKLELCIQLPNYKIYDIKLSPTICGKRPNSKRPKKI